MTVDAVQVVEGRMCPLFVPDVDTDQIMPKQFCKRIERTGFGELVFHDWRRRPGSVLSDERYRGAPVLVAGTNFGCGSSREHAVWGLQQFGFRAIVAPSYGDIFRSNCFKNGLVAVELSRDVVERLVALACREEPPDVRIDLLTETVVAGDVVEAFTLDRATRRSLLEGLDDIDLTLAASEDITGFESRRAEWLPVTTSIT